jgi:hypothetical protein
MKSTWGRLAKNNASRSSFGGLFRRRHLTSWLRKVQVEPEGKSSGALRLIMFEALAALRDPGKWLAGIDHRQ